MLFVDKIFTYFSRYEKSSDPNKDVNGKGTLERYNEIVGVDIDENLIPFIENLVKNVLEPQKCFANFVAVGEADMGVDLLLQDNLTYRRAILSVVSKLYQIKGTLKGYYTLFGKLGWSVVITEFFDDEGFDSPFLFDDFLRTFDMSQCPGCSDYSLAITTPSGNPPTSSELAAVYSIIAFNEPINARLRTLTFNGSTLSYSADFNNDFNEDWSI